MIPTGSKLWFGVSGFALVATVVYFLASRGEELGSMVLLSLAVAGFTLGLLASLIGDGDVPAPRAASPDEDMTPAVVTAPRGVQLAAAWPAFAAVGAGVVAVGLATGGILAYVGFGLLLAAGIEWMVQAWAERATADPSANRELRNRLMYPIEIPVLAAVTIAFVIIAFSRVLLAVSKVGSTVVAIVVAIVILGVAFIVTSRPKLSSSLLTVVVALGVIGLLGGGIIGAVAGEREFEAHHGEDDHAEGEGESAVELFISADTTAGFNEEDLTVPVGEPVTIIFQNNQGGVQHNVHVIEPVELEPGPIITGPDTVEHVVTFEEEGEYTFICDVHPNMEATITAVDQPAEGSAEEGEPEEGSLGDGGAGVDELDGDDS
ncbi:MAG: cupredoxin domain-containing protein [Acidimicrobiales bacterium]